MSDPIDILAAIGGLAILTGLSFLIDHLRRTFKDWRHAVRKAIARPDDHTRVLRTDSRAKANERELIRLQRRVSRLEGEGDGTAAEDARYSGDAWGPGMGYRWVSNYGDYR